MNLLDLVASIRINLDDFDRGLNEAGKKFKNFSKDLASAGDNLKSLLSPAVDGFKAVEGVGKTAGDAVVKGLKGFAAASTVVGGFGAAAVKSGMQFDASMSEVSAISGATGHEFQDLRDKALEMGAKTKFSASEAAEAMTYMGMAGWKTGDMLDGIEGIMNLAAASGEDLATTSDIVTDALTAFGKSAGDAGKLADIMAATATNANTDVGMMGDTFRYVAPVAGALGFEMEDTALAIGLMANSGIKATQAGTSLRSIFTRLSTDTGASKTQLGALGVLTEQLGVQFYRTDGSARSLYDILIDSQVAWEGLSEEQQISYAKTIAGQEAMSGWLALMNAAPEDVAKLSDAIYDCNGAAEEMARIMVDNLQGDLTLLKSAFESLQIAISDSLTPTLREFAQFGQKAMAQLLEGFQGSGVSGFMSALSGIVTQGVTMLAQKAPEFASVSLQFIGALGEGILNGKDSILEAGRNILTLLNDGVWYALENYTGDFIEFGHGILDIIGEGINNIEYLTQYIDSFVPLIAEAFMTYHEGLFGIGIEILGAIGKGIVENKEEIQSMASETITNMVTALRDNAPAIIEGGIALLEALVGAIMENMPLILSTGAEIIGQLVAGIASASPAVQAIIVGAILPHIAKIVDVVDSIKKVVGAVVDFVTGFQGIGKVLDIGKKLMGGIQTLFGLITAHPIIAVITAIIAAVILLWNNCEDFRNAVGAIWEAIKGFFVGAWEAIQAAWAGAGEFFGGIVDGIRGVFEGIGEFLGGVFSAAWGLVQAAWGTAVEFFSGIWNGIQTVFSVVADVLGGVFSAAWEAIKAAWSAVVEFFSGVWEGIQGVFSAVAEVLGGFFQSAWEMIQTIWTAAVDFFSGVWTGIQDVFSVVADVLGGFFSAAWDAITAVWKAATEFFSGIADGIHSAFEAVTQFLGDAFSAAWSLIETAWGVAVDFFSGVWDGISGVFSTVADWFGGVFSDAWNAVTSAWDGVTAFFSGVWNDITNVFSNVWEKFKEIGGNIVDGIKSGVSGAWDAFIGWIGDKVGGIVSAVKNMLGIHSPSTVFAGIGENMALGLAEGWGDEYNNIKRQIESGLNFGSSSIGLNANYTGTPGYGRQSPAERSGTGGNTYVTINSPKAVDGIEAAREWQKTSQRIALGLV